MVSRRIKYTWRCSACDGLRDAPVWRLLDSRERDDVIEQPSGAGLASVVCPQCRTSAEIDAPLLVIRPGDPLPLLLAVHVRELSGPRLAPPSGPVLEQEARAALGRNTDGIAGPMIPLPRSLLPVVLARDVNTDATDPDRAVREIFGDEETLIASWYRDFLEIVRDSEPERILQNALEQLWSVPTQELEAFLASHPELSTAAAVLAVKTQLDQAPPSGEDNPDVEQFRLVLRARLNLLAGLANGDPVPGVVMSYVTELERFSALFNTQLERLLNAISADPGAEGIPQLREAIDVAIGLHDEDLEAALSADLGARLLMQPGKDNAAVEESISLLQRALSVLPEGDQRWANVAANLGGAYQQRVSGDAIENWEAARNLIQRACEAVERGSEPRAWAVYQTNLGFLLGERPGGSTDEDLSLGIDHIRLSLEERSPERNVVDWAYSLINLGLLHQRRRKAGDDVIARNCYERALAHLRPGDDLVLWAGLQNNLADLLLSADSPDLDSAEAAIRSALAEINSSTAPIQAGRLTWQLARIAEGRTGSLTPDPLRLRRDALRLLGPLLAPDWHLRIGGQLADAYAQLDDWSAAATVYDSMLTAFDVLYHAQATAEGRRIILARNPRLARWAAYAFARTGRPEKAVEVIEQGRARQLSAAVSRDTADLARLAAVDQQLADRYRGALTRYQTALNETALALPSTSARDQVAAAERDLQLVLSDIHDIPSFERFLQPMTVADISSAVGGLPVIYLVSAPSGSHVLAVHADAPSGPPTVASVPVPEVTSRDIALLVLAGKDGAPGLLSAQSAGPEARRQLLPSALQRLNEIEPLLKPVADILARSPGHVAVVVPTGLLGLLPLPAAVVAGQILDDLGEIHLAPSAAAYAACRKRAAQLHPQQLVGVADPDGSLPGSKAELAAIRDLFEPGSPASCEVGADATREWVLGHISAASHLHLACHGASNLTSTTGGVLQLAGHDELSINDLVDGRLANCRLAVASACQSGHYAMADVPDEFTGLPAGLLQAGAACAVVSLWPVRDDITSIFMARFYELLDPARSGPEQTPVSALRQARTWLRQLTRQEAEAYKQRHPRLSQQPDRLDERGPVLPDTASGPFPYAAPISWAAFVAWGC